MDICKRIYNQNLLPECTPYFKEEQITELIKIPCDKPKIGEVLSLVVFPEVESFKLIETKVGRSNEGQVLTGNKLKVTLRIKKKLIYITNEATQTSQVLYYEDLKSYFVILPKEFKCQDVAKLIRLNKFVINPYVEYVDTRVINSRTIFESVLLYIGVKLF